MSLGPGKYDDACTLVRMATGAQAVLLIVVDGHKGSGFSVQCTDPALLQTVPDVLEDMARQIRADMEVK